MGRKRPKNALKIENPFFSRFSVNFAKPWESFVYVCKKILKVWENS
nr:MAG TPA: hypothetical protein [Caudoviricetes sp.]